MHNMRMTAFVKFENTKDNPYIRLIDEVLDISLQDMSIRLNWTQLDSTKDISIDATYFVCKGKV